MQDRILAAKHRAGDGPVKEVVDWSQTERDKFREIAKGAWKDFAAQSDLATEAYNAHVSFMQSYGLLK